MTRSMSRNAWLVLAMAGVLAWTGRAGAVTVNQTEGGLAARSVLSERLQPEVIVDRLEVVESGLAPAFTAAWSQFVTAHGGSWVVTVDRRSGVIELVEGSGVGWVPGYGNQLTLANVARYTGGGEVTLAALEAMAREFVQTNEGLFGVSESSLELRHGASGRISDYLWYVAFDVRRAGLRIEGAQVVFRVNNGNLVQFGTENLPADGVAAAEYELGRVDALVELSQWVGGLQDGRDWLLDPGTRRLLPVTPAASQFPEDFAVGAGYELMAVWEFVLRRNGEPGTYRARVDATTGEMVEFRDINAYAGVTGGVYPISAWFGDETVMPMPFADVSGVGNTDSAGQYAWPGGTVTSSLNARYVSIDDTCGSISMSSDADGNIAFGTSSGTDCATPGFGGAGNTHSSRMQFYQTNRIAEKARGWLPGNTWVQQQLTVNVNLNQTCNAYWDGFATNFFRSGGGCGNTGEMAGVSLHEWGHGFDENDGNGFSPDGGTGETYGDFTAALQTHDSCVGHGFRSTNCGGYGDPCVSCTGIRDVDWGLHASNTPHTVSNFTRTNCGSGWCLGPCGRECHCESYVSTEALWDLAEKDLLAGSQSTNPSYPDEDGPYTSLGASWQVVDRLWYVTRPTAGAAFACSTSGTWSSHGCGTSSFWKVFRVADDDDGNLANGTPHSCYIYAAFDRHQIACTTDPAADVCHTGCSAPAVPTLNASPGNTEVRLMWGSSGSGVVYDVFRNEMGCAAGFMKIADDVTSTTFTDTSVANDYTYYYQVTAQPAGNEACSSAPSNCADATPVPCTPPDPPATVAATAGGDNRIDVSWSAVPDAVAYYVYRSRSPGGPYDRIATVPAPSLTWADVGVSGGITYYYVVSAEDDCTESLQSAETSAQTSGVCTLAPLFAGAAAVTNPGLSSCTLEVSWDPATPECQGPAVYSVYRSTTPGFTPGVANRLAEGVNGTSFVDDWVLQSDTPYYYVVRAVDAGNGAEETNATERSGAPTGPITATPWFDDAGDTLPSDLTTEWPWIIRIGAGRGGSDGYRLQVYEDDTCVALTTPPLVLAPDAELRFWSKYDIQTGSDKGEVQVSIDGGSSWNRVPMSYPGSSSSTGDACGLPAGATYFTGQGPAYTEYTASLAPWAQQEVRLRWLFSTDGSGTVTGGGWWIDDITVADTAEFGVCTSLLEAPFFADGFESGDTSGWSQVEP